MSSASQKRKPGKNKPGFGFLDRVGVFVVGIILLAIPLALAIVCQIGGTDYSNGIQDCQGTERYVCRCNGLAMWLIFVVSLGVAGYLAVERCRHGELPRMRHAIASLLLIGLVIVSASIFAWNWLGSDDESNSATVRNVALGFAAVLTPIFVIWRERIASGKATSDRYSKAVRMLDDPNPAICIAGIGIIDDLCRYPAYRDMGLAVLNAFIEDPAPRQTGGRIRSREGSIREAKSVIAAWSKGSAKLDHRQDTR